MQNVSSGCVRMALLGCGAAGRQHAVRLASEPRAEVVVLYDPDQSRAEDIRRELLPRAVVAAGVEPALAWPGLDAAVIASPTQEHHAQVSQALQHGLHVLCEKPLATRREEIVSLLELARARNRVLAISYQRRYKAPYLTARRELLERAELYGAVEQIHLFVCERWEQTICGTWRDDPAVGAGYFFDAGSHQIDVISFITGQRPAAVLATSRKSRSRVEIVTQVWARYDGGAHLSAHFVGNAHHWREDIHFHCREADLLIRGERLWRARNNAVAEIEDLLPSSDPDRGFLDALLRGIPHLSPGEVALPMHDWTAAVLASARSGTWVELGTPRAEAH